MASTSMAPATCMHSRMAVHANRAEAPRPARVHALNVRCQQPAAKQMFGQQHAQQIATLAASYNVRAAAAAVDAPSANQGANQSTKTTKVAVITGASSGLGLNAAKALAARGDWHVVLACRDFSKAEKAAKRVGMQKGTYTVMHLDLASLESVRQFVKNFRATGMPLDALVCNAAVYLPTAKEPTYTADGFELSVGTNHLGHFLLSRLMLEDLEKEVKKGGDARMIIVGSITGNNNTLAGKIPPQANLGDLRGLDSGLSSDPTSMIDGEEFNGAKAYKDSKVCNMLTMRQFHLRYADSTGVTFASLYPGCIAETGLFRNHVSLFRTLFPPFQKYITKGYVSEEEAGRRLAMVVADADLKRSGVYWSFNSKNNGFENQVSDEVSDDAKGSRLWEVSEKLVGLA